MFTVRASHYYKAALKLAKVARGRRSLWLSPVIHSALTRARSPSSNSLDLSLSRWYSLISFVFLCAALFFPSIRENSPRFPARGAIFVIPRHIITLSRVSIAILHAAGLYYYFVSLRHGDIVGIEFHLHNVLENRLLLRAS